MASRGGKSCCVVVWSGVFFVLSVYLATVCTNVHILATWRRIFLQPEEQDSSASLSSSDKQRQADDGSILDSSDERSRTRQGDFDTSKPLAVPLFFLQQRETSNHERAGELADKVKSPTSRITVGAGAGLQPFGSTVDDQRNDDHLNNGASRNTASLGSIATAENQATAATGDPSLALPSQQYNSQMQREDQGGHDEPRPQKYNASEKSEDTSREKLKERALRQAVVTYHDGLPFVMLLATQLSLLSGGKLDRVTHLNTLVAFAVLIGGILKLWTIGPEASAESLLQNGVVLTESMVAVASSTWHYVFLNLDNLVYACDGGLYSTHVFVFVLVLCVWVHEMKLLGVTERSRAILFASAVSVFCVAGLCLEKHYLSGILLGVFLPWMLYESEVLEEFVVDLWTVTCAPPARLLSCLFFDPGLCPTAIVSPIFHFFGSSSSKHQSTANGGANHPLGGDPSRNLHQNDDEDRYKWRADDPDSVLVTTTGSESGRFWMHAGVPSQSSVTHTTGSTGGSAGGDKNVGHRPSLRGGGGGGEMKRDRLMGTAGSRRRHGTTFFYDMNHPLYPPHALISGGNKTSVGSRGIPSDGRGTSALGFDSSAPGTTMKADSWNRSHLYYDGEDVDGGINHRGEQDVVYPSSNIGGGRKSVHGGRRTSSRRASTYNNYHSTSSSASLASSRLLLKEHHNNFYGGSLRASQLVRGSSGIPVLTGVTKRSSSSGANFANHDMSRTSKRSARLSGTNHTLHNFGSAGDLSAYLGDGAMHKHNTRFSGATQFAGSASTHRRTRSRSSKDTVLSGNTGVSSTHTTRGRESVASGRSKSLRTVLFSSYKNKQLDGRGTKPSRNRGEHPLMPGGVTTAGTIGSRASFAGGVAGVSQQRSSASLLEPEESDASSLDDSCRRHLDLDLSQNGDLQSGDHSYSLRRSSENSANRRLSEKSVATSSPLYESATANPGMRLLEQIPTPRGSKLVLVNHGAAPGSLNSVFASSSTAFNPPVASTSTNAGFVAAGASGTPRVAHGTSEQVANGNHGVGVGRDQQPTSNMGQVKQQQQGRGFVASNGVPNTNSNIHVVVTPTDTASPPGTASPPSGVTSGSGTAGVSAASGPGGANAVSRPFSGGANAVVSTTTTGGGIASVVSTLGPMFVPRVNSNSSFGPQLQAVSEEVLASSGSSSSAASSSMEAGSSCSSSELGSSASEVSDEGVDMGRTNPSYRRAVTLLNRMSRRSGSPSPSDDSSRFSSTRDSTVQRRATVVVHPFQNSGGGPSNYTGGMNYHNQQYGGHLMNGNMQLQPGTSTTAVPALGASYNGRVGGSGDLMLAPHQSPPPHQSVPMPSCSTSGSTHLQNSHNTYPPWSNHYGGGNHRRSRIGGTFDTFRSNHTSGVEQGLIANLRPPKATTPGTTISNEAEQHTEQVNSKQASGHDDLTNGLHHGVDPGGASAASVVSKGGGDVEVDERSIEAQPQRRSTLQESSSAEMVTSQSVESNRASSTPFSDSAGDGAKNTPTTSKKTTSPEDVDVVDQHFKAVAMSHPPQSNNYLGAAGLKQVSSTVDPLMNTGRTTFNSLILSTGGVKRLSDEDAGEMCTDVVITGENLFVVGHPQTELATGSPKQQVSSYQHVDTTLFSCSEENQPRANGHGIPSTGREVCESVAAFVDTTGKGAGIPTTMMNRNGIEEQAKETRREDPPGEQQTPKHYIDDQDNALGHSTIMTDTNVVGGAGESNASNGGTNSSFLGNHAAPTTTKVLQTSTMLLQQMGTSISSSTEHQSGILNTTQSAQSAGGPLSTSQRVEDSTPKFGAFSPSATQHNLVPRVFPPRVDEEEPSSSPTIVKSTSSSGATSSSPDHAASEDDDKTHVIDSNLPSLSPQTRLWSARSGR
ncbi:unnamed protein product [Amoebophrya sp. A25]|nr:unnamed protein product [Amoebophrya sp. A25]|eukprot:GSA25T00019619001.1